MSELEEVLQTFTGSENVYRHWMGLIYYTDGVKCLAEKAKAYWLIDAIASWQLKFGKIPFQIWELRVNEDRSAILTMKEDTNEPIIVRQRIPFTNFPLKHIKLYLVDGVLMLPSEY